MDYRAVLQITILATVITQQSYEERTFLIYVNTLLVVAAYLVALISQPFPASWML